MRLRGRSLGILLVGLLGWTSRPVPSADTTFAVVVHPSAPLTDISLDDLRRLFLGKTKAFKNGQPITLLELTSARHDFYKAALGMSEGQVKRAWIALVFQGEALAPPREVATVGELRAFVAAHREAVGFLPIEEVDASVRALTIGGRGPKDPGYPLR